MIKIGQSARYAAKVEVTMLDEEGNEVETSFKIYFSRLTHEELEDLKEKVQKGEWKDDQVITRVVAGFGDDVVGKDDQPLPFTPENLKALVNVYPVRPAIIRKFYETVSGAKVKN